MLLIEIFDEDQLLPGEPELYLDRLHAIAGELDMKGTVVIKLGGKEESRELNHRYRQKDDATDVLSFPFEEELPEDGFYLGDIFICMPIAEEQAVENGIPLRDEVFTLMLHGLLHLAGHDHEQDDGSMMELQEKLLKKYHS